MQLVVNQDNPVQELLHNRILVLVVGLRDLDQLVVGLFVDVQLGD